MKVYIYIIVAIFYAVAFFVLIAFAIGYFSIGNSGNSVGCILVSIVVLLLSISSYNTFKLAKANRDWVQKNDLVDR
jgi:hypothetical protein